MTREDFDRLVLLGILENHPVRSREPIRDVVPETEPDREVWLSPTGYPCILVRNRIGAWCGYVGVPPEHPLALGALPISAENIDVHGGITYGPELAHWPTALCSSDPYLYVGFDCAHAGDLVPGILRFKQGMPAHLPNNDIYRDQAYAREECEKLAAQLRELEQASGSVDSATGRM